MLPWIRTFARSQLSGQELHGGQVKTRAIEVLLIELTLECI
jgi:hypothetical protein